MAIKPEDSIQVLVVDDHQLVRRGLLAVGGSALATTTWRLSR
jgi:hypothetical protein